MKKHTLSFQTVEEAEKACEILGPFVGIWQCLDLIETVLILRSTDQIDPVICFTLELATGPCSSVWNADAWAGIPYQHTFYYYDRDEAESAQEFLHWSFSAWSKVIPVSSGLSKVIFGTEKELTEQEQRDWCWTYDPNEFEFNEQRQA